MIQEEITYNWNFNPLDCYPTQSGCTNVVIRYLVESVPFEITAVHNHYGLVLGYGSALKSIGSIGEG
jgi:hypothetical protein